MKPKYLMVFLLCLLGLGIYLFYMIYSNAKENAIAELTNRQMIHAEQAKRGIEYRFSDLITYFTKISSSDHIINLDDQGINELGFALVIYPEAITAITRVDKAGRITYTNPYNADAIGQDISSQKHIKKILKTHKPVISDVFTAVQGYRAIALHVPVFNGTEFSGTLGILIDFVALSKRFIQDIQLGKSGYLWMVSKEGIEIYCPVAGHTGKSVFENNKDFAGILSMANQMVQGEKGIATYRVDQTRDQHQKTGKYHAVYLPIKIVDSFWTIVVVSSEDEALESLINLKNKLIMVVCLLLFISCLFSYSGIKSWRIVSEATKRQKAEKALKESEKKYTAIFENAVEGFFQSTPDGRFITVNPAFAKMLGYESPEELINHIVNIATQYYANPEDRKRYQQLLHTEGYVEHFEFSAQCKDGSHIWVSNNTRACFDQDGKIIRYEGTVQDITGRRLAEKALMESEEKYRSILESIEDGYYEVDMEGTFTFINDAMGRILGYSKDELTGLNNRQYMDAETSRKVFKAFNRVYKTGQPYKAIDWELIRKDGSKCYVETSVALKRHSNGQPIGFQGIARDVSERKESEKEKLLLEKRLRQSEKLESIGTLAGGIAHDFNNILFSVLGYAEMLLDDIPENSPFRISLNGIYTGALRAKGLVKQILAFSRQDSNELTLMKIQPVIKEVLKLIRSTIPTTIEIKQDIDNNCSVIKADPIHIHQIVMNLTTNAYHSMEDTGGELKISLKEIQSKEIDAIKPDMAPGAYVCLTVADTGKGMEKNVTDKIFDPFFTTKAIGKGTGMGLSVVHGIVTAMGGAIHVQSEPGKGTQFHVYLPIEKESFKEQHIHVKQPVQIGIERILLVDDENAIIDMEKQMLERLGYHVTAYTNSIEALEVFRDSPDRFDVVVTDMAMPNMPGDKLSVELLKIRPDIPILLCSGFSEIMSDERAASLGIKGFLLKPILMNDLSGKIRGVLG